MDVHSSPGYNDDSRVADGLPAPEAPLHRPAVHTRSNRANLVIHTQAHEASPRVSHHHQTHAQANQHGEDDDADYGFPVVRARAVVRESLYVLALHVLL